MLTISYYNHVSKVNNEIGVRNMIIPLAAQIAMIAFFIIPAYILYKINKDFS